jgi:two-component system sensor kinase FixL
VIRDISERKRADERLSRLQAELAHASRFNIRGEMVAGIAHQLNQPLSAILNYADVCR